jgi:small subunit ribosomal protein S9
MIEQKPDSPLIDPSILEKHTAAAPAHAAAKPASKSGFYWGTGRRKTACARVRIKPGEGKLIVNKRELKEFFTQEQDRQAVVAPLAAVQGEKQFDIYAKIEGGGPSGQAGAMALGIARALKNYDENFLPPLRDGGFLTRDGRMKERKKYGQRGARRRFQFSKR